MMLNFPLKCLCNIIRVNSALNSALPVLTVSVRTLVKHVYVPLPPNKTRRKQYKRLVQYPEEYTLKKLPIIKLGGRDPYTGRVVVGTIGGGRPQKARWIDFKRSANKDGSPYFERVFNIEYNPHNPARLAVVAGQDKARYITAHVNMKIGDIITTYGEIPKNPVRPKDGDAHPVGALPIGTIVHCIESIPGEGGHFCTSAGTYGTLLRKIMENVIIRLPSKQEISVNQWCMAVVGQVSNPGHKDIHIGSPNRLRRLGNRSRSGLWHRKDGYCGRKLHPLKPVKVYEEPYKDEIEMMYLSIPDLRMNNRTKPALIPDDSWTH